MWWGRDLPVFLDKRGGTHGEFRPAPPRLSDDPVRALERDNALHGAAPDAWTAATRSRAGDVREDVVASAADAVAELGDAVLSAADAVLGEPEPATESAALPAAPSPAG